MRRRDGYKRVRAATYRPAKARRMLVTVTSRLQVRQPASQPWAALPFSFVQYGYGLWHFQMTGPLGALKNLVPTWGASGSTGSFLYYSQPLDLYIAGTVDSADHGMMTFVLMAGAMSLVSGNDHPSHGA